MAYKSARGRIPLREQMLQHRAVMLAMCPDQEARDRLMRELPAIADKQHRAPRKASGEPTEAEILKAIMQYLRVHPKVAKVWRQNSGTFKEGSRFIRANTARGMSDIMGVLKSGRTLAIECKAKRGTLHDHQKQFLDSISAAGGLAFVARSVNDVMAALETA